MSLNTARERFSKIQQQTTHISQLRDMKEHYPDIEIRFKELIVHIEGTRRALRSLTKNAHGFGEPHNETRTK